MESWRAAVEYGKAVWHYFWIAGPSGALTVFGTVGLFVQGGLTLPGTVALILGDVGLLYLPFLVFKRVRVEREVFRQRVETLEAGRAPQEVIHRYEPPRRGYEEIAAQMGQHRADVLSRLHGEYIALIPNAPIPIRMKTAALPKEWVEKRLAEMHESWRREEYWP